MKKQGKRSFMKPKKGQQYGKRTIPAAIEDSPAIKDLIEQLNQDLEETVRNTSKSRQSIRAA